jgi:hypothetical protein
VGPQGGLGRDRLRGRDRGLERDHVRVGELVDHQALDEQLVTELAPTLVNAIVYLFRGFTMLFEGLDRIDELRPKHRQLDGVLGPDKRQELGP